MPAPKPLEVREAAVEAYLSGEGSVTAIALRFGLSVPSLKRYLALHRAEGHVAPKPAAGGQRPILNDSDLEVVRELVMTDPEVTLDRLADRVEERTGKRVSDETLSRCLHRMEIRRVRPPQRPPRPATPRAPDPARYKPAQRASTQTYATDLTDAEWEYLKPRFTGPRGRGRPPKYDARALLNAMFYVVRTGCAWRMLPAGFPPWSDVYKTFRRWTRSGRIRAVHEDLRRMWREREGRGPEPTAVIVDSQSARTAESGGPRGYDAGKKVKGRKRHIAVDTEGLLTELLVHEAHIQDRDGAVPLLTKLAARISTIRKVWFDAGYAGRCVRWVTEHLKWDAEVVRRPDDRSHGRWTQTWLPLPGVKTEFPVLPRRWVVERTFAWLGRCRRLSKDYEALIETSESVVWLASLRLIVARCAA